MLRTGRDDGQWKMENDGQCWKERMGMDCPGTCLGNKVTKSMPGFITGSTLPKGGMREKAD